MRKLLILLTLALPCPAQMLPGVVGGGAAAVPVITNVQTKAGRATWADGLSVSGSVATLTVSSTGSGNVIAISGFAGNNVTVSSATAAVCTPAWGIRAVRNSGAVGTVFGLTCDSSVSGKTSIAITFSGAPGDTTVYMEELSCAKGGGACTSFAYDVDAAPACAGSSSTPWTGASPGTLTGTVDYIISQMALSTGRPTGINSPFANFLNNETFNGANSLGFSAFGNKANTTSNTAPVFTGSGSASQCFNSIAIKAT